MRSNGPHACLEIRNRCCCAEYRRSDFHYQRYPVMRCTFLGAAVTRRGASVAYGYGGEAESRRKVDDGDDAAWCACAVRARRERRDRRKVGRGTSERARSGGTAGAGGHSEGALARGAAACAHRRALHSACTFERCGWDARVCWRERVTGSRVRQLQPRLLAQWFSILSSSQQHVRFCIEPPPAAYNTPAKAAILLLLRCDVFFIDIVPAVYNYGTKRQKFTLKREL